MTIGFWFWQVRSFNPWTMSNEISYNGGNPMKGAAVYVWHCNKEGEYSEYNTRMGGGDFSDVEIGRAVVYMANQGGGKLAEPKAPEAAASAASAAK